MTFPTLFLLMFSTVFGSWINESLRTSHNVTSAATSHPGSRAQANRRKVKSPASGGRTSSRIKNSFFALMTKSHHKTVASGERVAGCPKKRDDKFPDAERLQRASY